MVARTKSKHVKSDLVMIVDDQPANLRYVKLILESHDYRVCTVKDGQTALNLAHQTPPDLILLDILMPGIDGYEVCRNLKASHDLCDIPVIFISALDDPDEKVKAFDIGAVDYITKPFHYQEVLARVKTHLKLRHQQLEIQQLRQQDAERIQQLQHEVSQRQQTEDALRVLTRAIEHSAHSIVITDAEGHIEYVNPHFTEVTGYTDEEIMGKTPSVLKSGHTSGDEYRLLWETIKSGQKWVGEFHNRRKNGDLFWELATIAPVPDDTGRITQFVAVKEDITDRKNIEEQLRKTNYQMSLLNRLIALTSSTLDPEEVMSITSKEIAQVLDVPRVGASLISDDGQTAEFIADYVRDGYQSIRHVSVPVVDNFIYDYLFRYKIPFTCVDTTTDKRFRYLEEHRGVPCMTSVMIAPLTIRDKVVGALCCESGRQREFTDDELMTVAALLQAVTQSLENSMLHSRLADNNMMLRERVEDRTAQLKRINDRMAAILNHASDAILFIHADGAISMTNPAFNTLFDYEPDMLFGHPIMAIVCEDEQAQLEKALTDVRENGALRKLQVQAKRRDGSLFDAELSMTPVLNDRSHIVCTLHDVSHYKSVQRAKDRFISSISHELRTPITGMVISSATLRKHYERLPEHRKLESIDRIHTQANVLAELVEAILDISRMDMGRKKRLKEPVDMSGLVRDVLGEFENVIVEKNLTLHQNIQNMIMLPGDGTDFKRIWRNLISNAIKYTESGSIQIVLQMLHTEAGQQNSLFDIPDTLPDGMYLVGQVSDTGHGMSQEDLDNLFTRFYRGWASSSRIPGSGLGLSLVHELIEFYEGQIVVDSEPGRGSQFTFWLPYQEVMVS